MHNFPKISIITPNYNLDKYLEKTIQSVISQNYPNLEYIIIDGGSTDQSLEIINKYQSEISCFVSEKDNGLYDALNKGFYNSTGEIMGWINSDDLLKPNSLFQIAAYFTNHKSVQWLQGKPNVIDENDSLIFERDAVSDRNFFLMKEFLTTGKFIQQESTFWSRKLWDKAGSYISKRYPFAGDFELWMRFFKHEQLYCLNDKLGSFRKRNGQLSANNSEYLREATQIVDLHLNKLSSYYKLKLKCWKLERHLLSLINQSKKYQTNKINLS